jgi:hypothetical protein
MSAFFSCAIFWPMAPQRSGNSSLMQPVFAYLPGLELAVHILVETELALLHEIKRPHRCDGLTDRARQEKCGGCHGCASALRRHSIAFRTDDLEVVEIRLLP